MKIVLEVISVMFIFHSVTIKFLLFNLHIHCAMEWIQLKLPILLTIYDICSNFRIGKLGANHQLCTIDYSYMVHTMFCLHLEIGVST